MSDFEQQLTFIHELDRLKSVHRQTLVKSDWGRRENSAEHSWHISMMAHVLKDYAVEPIQIDRVVKMLLLHDVVEIDAGDTFAFADKKELDGQEGKELKALERLFGMLPEPQAKEMKGLWLEFEQAKTPDGRFAKAMDRILPILQNMNYDGGSWSRHDVSKTQVLQRNRHLKGLAPKLWGYVQEQVDIAVEKGWLLDR